AQSKTQEESTTRNFNLAVRHLTEQPRKPSGFVPGSSPGRLNLANRAANSAADPIETLTTQLRRPLSNRVLDRRRRGGSRLHPDALPLMPAEKSPDPVCRRRIRWR